MRLLNFGSLNYDYVYAMDHLVAPGETASADGMQIFSGGKGLNQSVALAQAGFPVLHAGLVGEDGEALLAECRKYGVETSLVKTARGKSGHTIIQVDKNGQNCILLYGGTNRQISPEFREEVFSQFEKGDVLLLQNELNATAQLVEAAHARGMQIVLNPAPFNDAVRACDLSKISIFLVNQVEGAQISGCRKPDEILVWFGRTYPQATVVLTLGGDGSACLHRGAVYRQKPYEIQVVDTTGAGDTFTGFFLAAYYRGEPVQDALDLAAKAASIAVSRPGAVPSIPSLREVLAYQF